MAIYMTVVCLPVHIYTHTHTHTVSCDTLPNPTNGEVSLSDGSVEGSTATYSCLPGYELRGSSQRMCGADTEWTGIAPVCVEGI